jgi:hypothetical protein
MCFVHLPYQTPVNFRLKKKIGGHFRAYFDLATKLFFFQLGVQNPKTSQ